MHGLAQLNIESPFQDETTLADHLRRIIQAGKNDKLRVFLCTTGAGTRTNWFLSALPGSSSPYVGGVIPYHRGVSQQFVDGRDLGSAVNPFAGAALANAAFLHGMEALLAKPNEADRGVNLVGIGVTAAIASQGRRGSDRIEIGLRTLNGSFRLHVELEKADGEDGRAWQQSVCDLLILNSLFAAVGLEQIRFSSDNLTAVAGSLNEGQVTLERLAPPTYEGSGAVLINADGSIGDLKSLSPETHIIYPGSFRVFHVGHDRAAQTAFSQTNKQVVLEIVAQNADRAESTMRELYERSVQMRGRWPVILRMDCGKFTEKAVAYPGFEYVVGFDTATRIVDPKFYGDDWQAMSAALDALKKSGARFHVLGRLRTDNGRFETVDDLWCARKHHDMFLHLAGRVDVSASALLSGDK